MNQSLKQIRSFLIVLLACPLLYGEDDHSQGHPHVRGHQEILTDKDHHNNDEPHHEKGPNGGHVVDSKAGFSFEVTVDENRKARIVFLDLDHKPLVLAQASITGIAGERSAPTRLSFVRGSNKDANVLISDKPLPSGDHVAVILMIKPTPDAKAVPERFELHLHGDESM